ncbi:hypothetical protein Q5P01_005739 [Channa striata]|uniref:Uncharacterized protein n=1 Tax=Channa striata TaxID=64152 RepID=A0AA88SZS6_CHASR|nr:hypothetical protein Q5P01_005739 [Channa striata]
MSLRYFEILRDSNPKGNCIPSGRQLPRTPPLSEVKRHLDFSNGDSDLGCEEPQHNTEGDARDQDDLNRTFDFNPGKTKTENTAELENSSSMLKGMKGYQLTAADLEFINRMKEEKLLKKYQGDLEEVQRLLKEETRALELACALKEAAQAELNKFPSCAELTDWVKVVLRTTLPSTDLTGLDEKSLLAMVTKDKVQRTVDKKRVQISRLEKMVANKRKEEAEERGRYEKQIANEQLKIQGLMSQLCDLTTELVQQEEAHKALQVRIKTQEEIKAKEEAAGASEEQQRAKSQRKPRGKQSKKAAGSAERLRDATNQSKSTRGKRTNSRTDEEASAKDDQANKSTRETLKSSSEEQTKPTKAAAERRTMSARAARRPQKKVDEQESSSQETLPAVRGRKKPLETTESKAAQAKSLREIPGAARPTSRQAASTRGTKKTAAAAEEAEEEAQIDGVRRSRRIAGRKWSV